MTEEKKRTATVLAVVLVVAILCSLCASLYSAKGIYDLKTEANAAQETTEDNVKIMNGEYEILSTTQISDAYKSGNTSGLSKKDQETLEMAKAVLEEVITDDMTTAYDKEKAIYDWMTSKLNYDTGVLQVIPRRLRQPLRRAEVSQRRLRRLRHHLPPLHADAGHPLHGRA